MGMTADTVIPLHPDRAVVLLQFQLVSDPHVEIVDVPSAPANSSLSDRADRRSVL